MQQYGAFRVHCMIVMLSLVTVWQEGSPLWHVMVALK